MLLYRDISVHTTTVCSNRFVNCPHCAKKVKHCDLETIHFTNCTRIIVPCPNKGCTLRIERAALQSHRNSCEYESVPCKYYTDIACPALVTRKDKELHESNYQLHLELALQTISKMKIEAVHGDCSQVDCATATKPTGASGTKHPLVGGATTNQASTGMECPLVDQSAVTQEDHRTLLQIPHQESMRESLLIPDVRYGTVTTYKVSNFEQLRSTKQVHYSPPIYTHPGGYKLCVAVHANGTSCGSVSHLSVAVHVMCGENDHNLAWPFSGEMVLELLNQDEDRYHHKKHLRFPSKLCDENSRVITGERNQLGFGYAKFIPYSVLHGSVRPSYVVNDTLFFRVSANATPCNSFKPWLTCTT